MINWKKQTNITYAEHHRRLEVLHQVRERIERELLVDMPELSAREDRLLKDYPGSRVCGHRDLSPDRNKNGEIEPEEWIKECPCFDVSKFVNRDK